MLGSVAVASVLGGAVNAKRNNTCATLVAGSSLMLLGTVLLSTLSNTVEVQARTYGFQVFVGLGFGLTVSTVSLGVGLESELRDSSTASPTVILGTLILIPVFIAVAQGIVAQVRVLGGSIGIAASTAILGVTQRRQLITTGLITPEQLATLHSSAKTFTEEQLYAVRQAYSDAFREDLHVCAIISGVCILITLAAFRRNPEPILVARRRFVVEEQERLRGLKDAKVTAHTSKV